MASPEAWPGAALPTILAVALDHVGSGDLAELDTIDCNVKAVAQALK